MALWLAVIPIPHINYSLILFSQNLLIVNSTAEMHYILLEWSV